MAGRPIHIAEPVTDSAQDEDGGRFRFSHDFLQHVSSPERLANAYVVIISVAGAFRKGKSFLLNFFLRYLRALSRGDATNWLHSEDSLSDGFHWRSGSERDTTGIIIWSEPFFITKPDGEEVAVLLMDTQGTFDHQSTQQDCTTIFAFSTLLSSVQIFNISQNIQETDLQYLRLFVEFAAMAKNSKEKVLQHLWFLVRDWQYPDEFEYGENGGAAYLNKVLACDSRKPRENQELRRGIQQHFGKAFCCLLPHPGSVVSDSKFRGEVSRLDGKFVQALEQFILQVAAPENITVKKLNGNDLTGKELISFLEVYFEAFSNGKMPNPRSIFTATVEMANISAALEAKQFVENGMRDFLSIPNDDEFNDIQRVIEDQAVEHFSSKCMEADSTETRKVRQKLQEELNDMRQRHNVLRQLQSEMLSADKKNEMLNEEVQSLQVQNIAGLRSMQEMEDNFNRRLDDIKQRSISKDEMKRLLQEEAMRHTTAMKEVSSRTEEFSERIEELMAANQELQGQLSRNQRQAQQQMESQMLQLQMQKEQAERRLRESKESDGGCSIL